ncbi:MAG: 50S ribosomal protein L6 [Actinomycetota bacterium]
MSRVGLSPIPIPSGVEVQISSGAVRVKGPKGELHQPIPEGISVEQADGELRVARANDQREVRALHGLIRSLIANMVRGVTEGFERALEIQGVGYRAAKKGNDLELTVGYSHPVNKKAPSGIEFEVPQPTRIVVRGIDKELVGQTAAEIRAIRKPEPYKGKGIRYEGEQVRRKAGKAAKAAAI